jgi:hypothetical protein
MKMLGREAPANPVPNEAQLAISKLAVVPNWFIQVKGRGNGAEMMGAYANHDHADKAPTP